MSLQQTIKDNVEAVRVLAAQFLTDTCKVRRKSGQVVINGENVATYATGVTTACRLIIRSGSESMNIASQERVPAQSQFTGLYRLQLPYGTSITVDDHIEYTDNYLGTVRTFEVIFVPPFNIMTGAFIIALREVK